MSPVHDTAVTRKRKPDLVPGYTLEVLLGKGGMGEVHKATQLSLGRTVAVKLLAPELAKDTTFVARFEKEAAALAALSHPNIVAVVDKGCAEGTYFLVMEYVDGSSLREVLRRPELKLPTKLRIVCDVCRAMEYAHGRGIVHRDLKPENVLVDEQAGGIPKVSDFGLAGFLDEKSDRFRLTGVNAAMGTLSYMAPEQRTDAGKADHRADIYSLGVILYEFLTGELPAGQFDPPSARAKGVDKRLDAIVGRCLKPAPEERFQNVGELLSSFEPLVPMTASLRPQRVGLLERARLAASRWAKRAVRAAAVLLVLAATALLALTVARPYLALAPSRGLPGRLAAFASRGGAPTGSCQLTVSRPARGPVEFQWFGHRPSVEGEESFVVGADAEEPTLVKLASPAALSREGLHWGVEVERPEGRSSPRDILWEAVRGNDRHAEATLLLMGEGGRYAAVSVFADGSPARFEYALGAKRGAMELMVDGEPRARQRVSLGVDAEGRLSARVGDAPVGEPVPLGASWRDAFGGDVQPAMACLGGTCRFGALVLTSHVP